MYTVLQSMAPALADRYRIERELGSGGMATVFLAFDLKHGRPVAIKVLNPEVGAAIGQARFLREIEIVARLTHPHILPLHDSGVAAGELYYVTPYIEGESLRTRLNREGRLSITEAMRLAREIANGLGHAHHRGLVHRDVKPENVLLADGMALVADFGIARPVLPGGPGGGEPDAVERVQGSGPGGTHDATNVSVTIPGAVMGTPLYMAPEQIMGSVDIDARADIYSLGCVLYEMLAGQPPFTGPTREILAYQHQAVEPRPVTELRAEVPAGIVMVLARALAKAPGDRYATTARFADALGVAAAETVLAVTRETLPVPGNLPKERTSFIGRESDLAECARLLDHGRMLTLIGVGGCGKSRLALRLAEDLRDRFPDGAWLVDLAPVLSPDRVPQVVAGALRVSEEPGVPLMTTIIKWLSSKRVLLVLDNCEHLLAACAGLSDTLLTSCAEVKVLATSREGLAVSGERCHPVGTLSLPASAADRTGVGIEASEAVRLFVERARAVVPDFSLTAETGPEIAEICRRLDGIPLAVELAAARIKMLSPDQIRARLDDRFRLLTGGTRAIPRQQTLLATIQWSHSHLPAEMQRLFETLSVFVGGWTLEAASAVMGEESDEFEVLDLMTGLVDKSMVLVGREGKVPRYRMLETMRQFAQDRLSESGAAETVRQRHLMFHLALVEEAETHLSGGDQADWFQKLDRELENILAAHAWCDRAEGGAELGLRLAGGLRLYWVVRGLFDLGLRTTTEALARGCAEATASRGSALAAAGLLSLRMGNVGSAQGLLEESIAISRRVGDRSGLARALSFLGLAILAKGDRETAHRHLEEAVAIAQGIDKVTALNSLAWVRAVEPDSDRAAVLFEQALALARELGSTIHTAATLHNLAIARILQRDYLSARAGAVEAFELSDRAGMATTRGGVLEIVSMLAAAQGEPERAARLWGAADAVLERIGIRRSQLKERALRPLVDRTRQSLGETAFDAAYAGGKALSEATGLAEAQSWLNP